MQTINDTAAAVLTVFISIGLKLAKPKTKVSIKIAVVAQLACRSNVAPWLHRGYEGDPHTRRVPKPLRPHQPR